MLAFPMRSQDSSPSRLNSRSYTGSLPARHREPSPRTPELRMQVADAILSVMPSPRPSTPKRPKLSLQTSIPSSPPTLRLGALSTHSPTPRKSQADAFEPPAPTTSSPVQPQIDFPYLLAASLSSVEKSPFSNNTPYVLPIGAHSILRNSPLPRRHVSTVSVRQPRRMFPPVKRVAFQEKLVDNMPTPTYDVSSEDEDESSSTEEEQQRRREAIQAEDGHTTPIVGRRKRRRDWIWRPLDDDDDDNDDELGCSEQSMGDADS